MSGRILRWLSFIAGMTTMNVLAQAGEIVDTAHVADALEKGAIVWDVRDAGSYAAGHIPGAVNVGAITTVLRDPTTENWLPTAQVEAVLGKAGIDLANREVIAYAGTGDPTAYFGLLTVRYFGGRSGKVYHGGVDAWKAAGKPVATEPAQLAPVTLKLETRQDVVVWTEEMVRKVAEAKAGTIQIIDVRTPPEYSGQAVSAIRGGHIPGAVNIPVGGSFTRPPTPAEIASGECASLDGMALKPTADLEKLYANLDRDKETIVYCQSGGRASVTVTVLRELGFDDVKLYKPGWLGYAATLSAPADDETFVNIGVMNQHIRTLEARVTELEKEIAELRRAK